MGRRVALVDDDADIRESLQEILKEEGYEVDAVPNGLKLARALLVNRPDVILLDVMMSWIDGYDLCRAIKQNSEFSSIPVIFISARTAPEDIQKGLECGAVDYITKPIHLDRLLRRLEEVTTAGGAPAGRN